MVLIDIARKSSESDLGAGVVCIVRGPVIESGCDGDVKVVKGDAVALSPRMGTSEDIADA